MATSHPIPRMHDHPIQLIDIGCLVLFGYLLINILGHKHFKIKGFREPHIFADFAPEGCEPHEVNCQNLWSFNMSPI